METAKKKPVLVPDRTTRYTRQEAFNVAWRWAVTLEHDLCKCGEGCGYRNAERTNACLIGAMIPDSLYERMSRASVPSCGTAISLYIDRLLLEESKVQKPLCALFDPEDAGFLHSLQRCHDDYDDHGVSELPYSDYIRGRLTRFAETWGLIMPSVPAGGK